MLWLQVTALVFWLQVQQSLQNSNTCTFRHVGTDHMHQNVQVVSIPFHIWSMLGTLPLRAAYLQQLLHICQALQFQPSRRAPPTHLKNEVQRPTTLTYSNANIEAINSALAAQWSKPAYNTPAPSPCAPPLSCHQLPPPDHLAAAEAASQLGSHDRSAAGATAQQRSADAVEQRSTSGITLQSRNSSLYSSYNQQFHNMAPHGSMQSLSPQDFAHMSQMQGLTQGSGSHSQGGMQCSGLQGLRDAEAAVIRQSMDTPQSLTPSLWGHSAGSRQQGIAEQGQPSQLSLEAWTGQGMIEQGQSAQQGQEAWTGQTQGGPRDDPLNAAEYEAVVRLQSLALQLQRTGTLWICNLLLISVYLHSCTHF